MELECVTLKFWKTRKKSKFQHLMVRYALTIPECSHCAVLQLTTVPSNFLFFSHQMCWSLEKLAEWIVLCLQGVCISSQESVESSCSCWKCYKWEVATVMVQVIRPFLNYCNHFLLIYFWENLYIKRIWIGTRRWRFCRNKKSTVRMYFHLLC